MIQISLTYILDLSTTCFLKLLNELHVTAQEHILDFVYDQQNDDVVFILEKRNDLYQIYGDINAM
jgi:hypothetical protein